MGQPDPLFDYVFDQRNLADGQRFLRLIEELKVLVSARSITHGILLHKWLDATHIHVVVFPGSPEGKVAAEALLVEGFTEGPFLGPPAEPDVSDLVRKVKSATAHLEMPPGQAADEIPGQAPGTSPGKAPGN